jgi:hypothetical protein
MAGIGGFRRLDLTAGEGIARRAFLSLGTGGGELLAPGAGAAADAAGRIPQHPLARGIRA